MTQLISDGYFDASTTHKKKIRNIIFGKYLDEAQGDLEECVAMMWFDLVDYEREEYYEHCAVLKDILEQIENR